MQQLGLRCYISYSPVPGGVLIVFVRLMGHPRDKGSHLELSSLLSTGMGRELEVASDQSFKEG